MCVADVIWNIYCQENSYRTRASLSPDMNFPGSIYSISRQLHTCYCIMTTTPYSEVNPKNRQNIKIHTLHTLTIILEEKNPLLIMHIHLPIMFWTCNFRCKKLYIPFVCFTYIYSAAILYPLFFNGKKQIYKRQSQTSIWV